ncbi:hypothetical protein niasHS_001462 [Heterodera schachtii]|uniref:Uncharacterized protein n=1 Tax=Heterodera schachtii TaxID=97005 RepID=A0ABD2KDI6_HETSC
MEKQQQPKSDKQQKNDQPKDDQKLKNDQPKDDQKLKKVAVVAPQVARKGNASPSHSALVTMQSAQNDQMEVEESSVRTTTTTITTTAEFESVQEIANVAQQQNKMVADMVKMVPNLTDDQTKMLVHILENQANSIILAMKVNKC